jgi:hypothetical protein
MPTYTEKRGYFARHSGQFSVLFIGSSRIRAHVDPRTFDRTLEASGVEHRSFNMGVNALSLMELDTLVDEVIRLRPGALRYVFIEPVFKTDLPWANVRSVRSIYFHDLPNTVREIRCNLASRSAVLGNFRNALAFGYHYSNVGRVIGTHSGQVDNAHWSFSEESLAESRGYREQGAIPSPALRRWHRAFRENAASYKEGLEKKLALSGDPEFRLACQYDVVIRMAERLRAAGMEPIFLITPTYDHAKPSLLFTEYLRQSGYRYPVLSYLRSEEDLYEPELWYDARHLTGEGAQIFSELLARDAADLLGWAPPDVLARDQRR